MKMIGSVSCFSSLILPVFSCCAVFCVSCTSRPKQAICAGRRKKAAKGEGREGQQDLVEARRTKAQQNRTEQNRQKLQNRKNIQEQTKPYLQNKQLILACGSRARQRLPADGQKCDMESQVGHIAINRPDKAHQSLIYYARAHTHARSAKMTKNMAVLRSL